MEAKTAAFVITCRVRDKRNALTDEQERLRRDHWAASDRLSRAKCDLWDRRSSLKRDKAWLSNRMNQTDAHGRKIGDIEKALDVLPVEEAETDRQSATEQRMITARLEEVATELDVVNSIAGALAKATDSRPGLAPWDGAALTAMRLLGVSWMEGIPMDEEASLQARDVAALFKEHLGISRSLFYDRFRPLLRTYNLSPMRTVTYSDGTLGLDGYNSIVRFRRDEVMGLLTFIKRNMTL
jgi:hypothetical protein